MERRHIDNATRRIVEEVMEGLRHGHFKLTVQCITVQNGVRRLVVESGKAYKFDIPEDELGKAA